MSGLVLAKLAALCAAVGLGWLAARGGWLGDAPGSGSPTRVLSAVAFHLCVPALLFRTMAAVDLTTLPVRTLAAYYGPTVAVALAVYAAARWRQRGRVVGPDEAAGPAVRAITATFGNGAQVGLPVASALFGAAGLGLHIALISVHALVLMTLMTVLAEQDRARAGPTTSAWVTARSTARHALLHPIVLPVLAGLAWNATGWPLPAPVDELLALLGAAVVPVCLLLIGASLQLHGLGAGDWRPVAVLVACKLLVLPALVAVVAHAGFGLAGMPLAVLVLMAALPVGSNALIFAQRYRVGEAQATVAIVASTLAYAPVAAGWLALLAVRG